MRAQTDLDLIKAMGRGVAGMPVPEALSGLPIDRLRFDGSTFVDAAQRTTFAIDEQGTKRLPEMALPAWPVQNKGPQTWTAPEQDEVEAFYAAWAKIKAIRTASNQIEQLTPIPTDYRDDAHWP